MWRFKEQMRNVLIIQAILVLAGAAVSRFYLGDAALLPAFYGGAVALANTMLLSRRVARAGELAKTDPQRSVYVLYFGVVQRFVFVLVALGFGLAFLFKEQIHADPNNALALIGTFMVAQLAYVLMGTRQAG